jgi:hypothetical protein
MDPSGAMSFPFCFTKRSVRKEDVDADWDVLLLLLHWYRMDLGRNPEWLPLHLLLRRPVDDGRTRGLSSATREDVRSPAVRKKVALRWWRERRRCGRRREREGCGEK